jgi:Uma2 family endonuclease
MSDAYEEIIEGETILRFPPGDRHERVLERMLGVLRGCALEASALRLLEPRAMIQLTPGTLLRPDLSLVGTVDNRLCTAIEVIDSDDHRPDTVVKKTLYEDLRVPRLWMVDPRYNNVEIYICTEYGLALKAILAGREALTDERLPLLDLPIKELFA